jgi:hypothetical protein
VTAFVLSALIKTTRPLELKWVSVKGDLKEGDKVAIRGAERLTDDQLVVVNS